MGSVRVFFFLAEDGIRDADVTGVQTCALPISGCSGTFCNASASGLWTSGVVRYLVAPNVELIGRAGLDFGDDDGLLFGIGAGYIVNRNLKLRLEFVAR